MNTAQPINQNSRIVIIDVIRGSALLGVLVANLTGFINFALPEDKAALLTTTRTDKITEHFISLFIEGKFITIFSMLFGYGFGVLMERVTQRGMKADLFFIRRMIILLIFGLIHLAVWWGEILNVYAMAGLLLMPFRKLKTKNLLWLGLCLFLVAGPLIQAFKIMFLPPVGDRLNLLLARYEDSMLSADILAVIKANYSMVVFLFVERWSQWRDVLEALGKFLLGYYIFRSGYLVNLQANISLIKKVFRIALVVALLYLIKRTVLEIFGLTPAGRAFSIADYIFSNIGILALSLVYCSVIIQLYHRRQNLWIFKGLSSIGMMSLTNYLTQTLFYSLFFYGSGFGMIGKLHMQWVLPLGISLFAVQMLFSLFWMRRFQYGFAEWIWRMLSYNKYIAIKK
ncbi:MAG TPA: DUF418 domain-containing protein [Mucilaginibacter sp.]|nr:DUF418 domain-containing protein [Mucilaginibacter sp.]